MEKLSRIGKIDCMRVFLISLLSIAIVAINSGNKIYAQSYVPTFKVKVLETFPHDRNAYTQGLFFHKNQMYESCGQYGSSSFRKVDFKTGKVLKKITYPKQYFIEGSVVVNEKLFILTWQEKTTLVYDINTLKQITTYFNPRDGWGATTDGKRLIVSDGSSYLFFMDPSNFKELSKIQVKINGKPLDYLNELEMINGEIWANVYQTDKIVIINPSTGNVRAIVDCKDLLPANMKTAGTDVLNGIAYNPETKSIYLTGKNWPQLFRIELTQ